MGFISVGVIGAEVCRIAEGEGTDFAQSGSKGGVLGRVDGGERGTAEESVVSDRGKFRSVRKGNRGERSAIPKSVGVDRGHRGRDRDRGKGFAAIKSAASDRGHRGRDFNRGKVFADRKSAASDRSKGRRKRN